MTMPCQLLGVGLNFDRSNMREQRRAPAEGSAHELRKTLTGIRPTGGPERIASWHDRPDNPRSYLVSRVA